jgi:uncharacterized protein YabE (DUF348 family)
MEISVARAQVVTVDVDGRVITRRTQAATVAAFLQELGITLGEGDQVIADNLQLWPSGDENLLDTRYLPKEIVIRRSVPIQVNDNGVPITVHTSETTVGKALEEAGITLYLGDDVQPELHTRVEPDMLVSIGRSSSATVIVDGQEIHTRTHSATVGEFLAELGIALIGQDYALPNLDEALSAGATVRVVRVREEIVTEQEPIPYETAWQPDANLEIDQQQLAQQGAPGVLQRRIRVRYENGQEVSRVLEDEWVAQEPTTHILSYGTMIVIRTLDTPDGPVEYWRKIRVLATSYTAASSGKAADHPTYGITATGMTMRKGIVAVDPRIVNLYQEVYVPGYGQGIAADTGGAIKGRRIDLGYDEDNLVLWYSWVDLYLLTPPPDPSKIRYHIGS